MAAPHIFLIKASAFIYAKNIKCSPKNVETHATRAVQCCSIFLTSYIFSYFCASLALPSNKYIVVPVFRNT